MLAGSDESDKVRPVVPEHQGGSFILDASETYLVGKRRHASLWLGSNVIMWVPNSRLGRSNARQYARFAVAN